MTYKRFFLLGVILLSACQGATVTPVPSTPDIHATITTEMKNNAQIKPSDNGKTFTYRLTDRFTVFLDDTKYPVMFEAAAEGTCRLEDHDFHVDIVVNP